MAATQENGRVLDLVVIGAGPGGYTGAIRAAQLGMKTAIVEKDPDLGGTCLLRGCIPTKALLQSASLYHSLRHAGEFGFQVGDIQVDFPAIQRRKAGIVERLSKGIAFLMKKNRIQVFEGTGRIEGPGRVSVTSRAGEIRILETRNILLAAGSEAKGLPGIQPDGTRILTSDHALDLASVPRSLIILGAGAVGAVQQAKPNWMVTEVSVPPPGRLWAVTAPPNCRMKSATMASPRPVPSPFFFVVKKGSKIRSRTSSGIPHPVSRTVSRIQSL